MKNFYNIKMHGTTVTISTECSTYHSEQKCLIKSLSSYMLVKWTRTAIIWSSSCLYTAWLVTVGVGVAVLHCSGAVKTPNTFTNEEYANIKFVYGLCNANCRAAVVEFHHRHPHCGTLETILRILRETGSFPWVNAECEEPRHGEIDVLVEVQN
jgi:hypothetical protein